MELGDFLGTVGAGLTSTTGVPVWVSVLAPSVALLTVIVTQAVLLRNERVRTRMEHSKIARDAGETLAEQLYEFRLEAWTVPQADPPDMFDELETMWGTRSKAAYSAAMRIPSPSHRSLIRTFILILNAGDHMSTFGFGLSNNPRGDYLVPAEAAYEVATAWLRHEKPSRRHRRLARKANRAIAMHKLELQDMYEPDRVAGVFVVCWRWLRGTVRTWLKRRRAPIAKLWADLFAR